jgi:hypothetical protein
MPTHQSPPLPKLITFSPCPNCGAPIASNEYYHAGHQTPDLRHPMLQHLPARGQYCDHFVKQETP